MFRFISEEIICFLSLECICGIYGIKRGNRMNKTESTTIQLSEIIYLAYFTVMFGARAIGLYEGMLPYNIMLVIGMLLFLLKIAMTRHTFAEYLLMGTLLFISLIVYYNTGEKGLLLYFTMMLGMKNVSLKRVMKWAAAILSISFTVG